MNKHIENAATGSLLKAVFPGDAMVLNRRDQERLATWAVKTAYADWGKQFKTRGVPIGHRRYLRAHAILQPRIWVSISRCTGDIIQLRTGRNHVTPGDGSPPFWTHEFNLAIGNLAFKVWSPTQQLKDLAYKSPTSQAVRIWPIVDEDARWPPGKLLNPDELGALWELNPRANRT